MQPRAHTHHANACCTRIRYYCCVRVASCVLCSAFRALDRTCSTCISAGLAAGPARDDVKHNVRERCCALRLKAYPHRRCGGVVVQRGTPRPSFSSSTMHFCRAASRFTVRIASQACVGNSARCCSPTTTSSLTTTTTSRWSTLSTFPGRRFKCTTGGHTA